MRLIVAGAWSRTRILLLLVLLTGCAPGPPRSQPPEEPAGSPTAAPLVVVPDNSAAVAPPVDRCLGAPAYPERLPENSEPNRRRVPIRPWTFSRALEYRPYYERLTGDCQGTTEQILEWGARKWIPPDVDVGVAHSDGSRASYLDVVKAVAVRESRWEQDAAGDSEVDRYCWTGPPPSLCWPTGNQSFGITQIKRSVWVGSYDESVQSTAFNVDYWGMVWRNCYDGSSWQKDKPKGDLWACVSMWFSGNDPDPNSDYAREVKRVLRTREWQTYPVAP
jgi:hypothetical protein